MIFNRLKPVSARLQKFCLQKILVHQFASFAILHALIILGLYTILDYQIYIDPGGLERWFALTMLNGHSLPYHDFVTEYPPLALLTFILPALVFREPLSFALAFATEIFLADIIVLYFLLRISERINLAGWRTLGVYTFLLLFLGSLTTLRHDMIPAMLTVAISYTFIFGKNRAVWILLGLGIMTKVFPAVLAPLVGLYYLFVGQYRVLFKGIIIMLIIISIIALPWLIIDAHGFLYFLGYHADRGLQSESSYATILLVAQVFGLTKVNGVFNFSSWNLSSPLADKMAGLSIYIMLASLVIIYLFYARKLRYIVRNNFIEEKSGTATIWLWLKFSALAVLALLLTDKVLSPQYLIWICPLIAILNLKQRYLLWSLFIITGILTQYVYPFNYSAYEMGETVPVLVEASRNILLLAMTIIIGFSSEQAQTIRLGTEGIGQPDKVE